MSRHLFAAAALTQIPTLLTLQDRNPHSPTYGCFDRNFWQYKIIDFPSGMAQEFVLPLALVYSLPLPDNPYYRQPSLRRWIVAGMHYAAHSAHQDGSCDDYFPFERASGAAAFSLLACLDSYGLLELEDSTLLNFFRCRADWLAHHQETGKLTNHQALICLCLRLTGQLLHTDRWQVASDKRLTQVLSWQNPEGWFQEYEGFDPGYQTLTVGCLARLYQLQPDAGLKDAIVKAVRLTAHFIHPDGSYGGEYTSRNTYNFFPHGFELVGRWLPEALSINDKFLDGLAKGQGACYADDHIIGHHGWSYLLAWRDFVAVRPNVDLPRDRLWLPQARILVERCGDTTLYVALNKGGVFKLFRGDRLVASDTQISLQITTGGGVKNAVGHLVGHYPIHIEPGNITISGSLGWAKQTQMTPLKLIVLRLVMLSLGRFFPNLVRRLLQKVLITGKSAAPVDFKRQLQWRDGQWHITDTLTADCWSDVASAGIAPDQTSIYVVMSRTYQAGQLQPWLDLTSQVQQLKPGEPLILERSL